MLRLFFVLLSLLDDYEIATELAGFAFRLGLVNVSIFTCSGVLLAIRHWLTNRNPAGRAG